jgi:hypothetical protein
MTLCRWRRQFHAGDHRAVAAGAMAQTEALALIAAMLRGGPRRRPRLPF